MGVGILDMARRIRGDAAGGGLVDDLGADRGVEGEDHSLDVCDGQALEPLQLEDRCFQPQQQSGIDAVGQRLGAGPAGRPFGAAEDRGEAFGQRRRGLGQSPSGPKRSR